MSKKTLGSRLGGRVTPESEFPIDSFGDSSFFPKRLLSLPLLCPNGKSAIPTRGSESHEK